MDWCMKLDRDSIQKPNPMKTKKVIGTRYVPNGTTGALTGLDSVHQDTGEVCG